MLLRTNENTCTSFPHHIFNRTYLQRIKRGIPNLIYAHLYIQNATLCPQIHFYYFIRQTVGFIKFKIKHPQNNVCMPYKKSPQKMRRLT